MKSLIPALLLAALLAMPAFATDESPPDSAIPSLPPEPVPSPEASGVASSPAPSLSSVTGKKKKKKKKPAKGRKASPEKRAGTRSKLPKLLREVEALYSKTSTLSANFEEKDLSAAMGQTKTSSGTLEFKRPGMVRWETLKPDRNLLVSDGDRFWYYTPPFDPSEHGQYIEKRSSEVQSKLAQTLLSANFSSGDVARAMTIRQVSPREFMLTPKEGTAGSVKQARIEIDPVSKTIVSVKLEHKGGNESEIHLSDISLGQALPEDHFQFIPPPNTDHVTE